MNIHDFRARIAPTTLAFSNRFMVTINMGGDGFNWRPDMLESMRFMASDVQLAGKTLETEMFRYWGPSFNAPIQTKHGDLQISFYTKDDMREWLYFQDWMNYIHGDGQYDFRWMNQYVTSITIEKFSEIASDGETPDITLILDFNKAYPVGITDVPLTWVDTELFKTAVQFSYTNYKIRKTT